jgi:Fur family ferric uptake transcriptional regulator
MSDSVLVDALRAKGLRLTPQRVEVLAAVRRLDHATPEQIHAEVADTGMNITTVYRTLELLEELRLVTHTHLSHGAPTFHAVGDDRHVHLVCRSCEAVTEVDPELFDDVATRLLTAEGFVMDVDHLALFGRCAACASGGRILES